MKNISAGWFEIYVKDMERAKKFYEAVFETTLEKLPTPMDDIEMWSFPNDMKEYGAGGALAKMERAPVGCGGTIVYFSSEDCAEEEGRIETNGGKIHESKKSLGEYGFMCLFEDTEGNMIGLHSMK